MNETEIAQAVLINVSDEFGLDIATLRCKTREKRKVNARQAVMYLLWKRTDMTYSEIGEVIGCTAPATVGHGHQAIAVKMSRNHRLKNMIDNIERRIQ